MTQNHHSVLRNRPPAIVVDVISGSVGIQEREDALGIRARCVGSHSLQDQIISAHPMQVPTDQEAVGQAIRPAVPIHIQRRRPDGLKVSGDGSSGPARGLQTDQRLFLTVAADRSRRRHGGFHALSGPASVGAGVAGRKAIIPGVVLHVPAELPVHVYANVFRTIDLPVAVVVRTVRCSVAAARSGGIAVVSQGFHMVAARPPVGEDAIVFRPTDQVVPIQIRAVGPRSNGLRHALRGAPVAVGRVAVVALLTGFDDAVATSVLTKSIADEKGIIGEDAPVVICI